jgi:hypothetical protein
MMKRKAGAEKAATPSTVLILLTTKMVAARIALSPQTLQNWRGLTPKRYSVEIMKAMAARGERIYPPFIKLGSSRNAPIRYIESELNEWINLMPKFGQLPKEEEKYDYRKSA